MVRILPSIEGEGNPIRSMWDRLSPLPGGRRLYSRMLGRLAPYTGSIHGHIEELREGYARVTMRDRPAIRNHLRSVHAVALFNLAELTGNVALGYSLPQDARFIPTAISIEYVKKARGTITGTSECPVPTTSESAEYAVPVTMTDAAGDVVARATLTTLVGPKRR